MTKQQVEDIINKVNKKLEPIESAFMDYVIAYKCVGYGRMIQMIQKKWEQDLDEDRVRYDGNSQESLP